MLQFDVSFFDSEIREGFMVSGLMKRAWAAQMEVLDVIEKICRKHNIIWFADGGTLLGAIRHKGFIPWDDDIDIAMKRDDYNNFLSVIKTELPKDYVFNSFAVGNVLENVEYCFFLRIANSNSICFNEDFLLQYHGFPYIAGVDIFPLDSVPDDTEERELLYRLVRLILETEKRIDSMDDSLKINVLSLIEEACNVELKNGNIHVELLKIADALTQSYSISECQNIVGRIGWYAAGGLSNIFPKSCYERAVYLPFENIEIPVPCKYDEVAQGIYGKDYMIPIYNTQNHGYPFWKAQKEEAYDKLGYIGYREREEYVANMMHLDKTEVFEMYLVDIREHVERYRYFCQGQFYTIQIPCMR